MRQLGTQSSKYFRKIVTFVLTFAMIITSLTVSSFDSQAAKKVKKVSIGVKVGSSGILVLKKGQKKKLNVSVTPKKASKKVSYKSSKSSIVSVSSKGVVKAKKSKGAAKITVTSKQNSKKKATIKVKIGTPVKKVTIAKTAKATWQSANFVIKEVNGQKKKEWPKYSETLKLTKGTYTVMSGRTITLKTSISPKKATYKKVKWTSSKKGIVSLVPSTAVGTSIKVATKKVGTTTIKATAMDGSGKIAKVKLNVVKFESDKTPAPTAVPDTRKRTTVEDFESYEVGTTWTKFTSAGKNAGHMTVVQDPEDATNKCLQIKLDGTENAFDYAPVFNVDLSKLKDSDGNSAAAKTLGNYTAINADLRVVGNSGDAKYKEIFCYFDQAGKIQASDHFATANNESASAHGVDATNRFGNKISMATGSDVEEGAKLFNGNETTQKQMYFPCFYESVWKMETASTHYIAKSCTPGYKMAEADAKVGFASRMLSFNTARINEADNTLLNQNKFDVVLGTYFNGNPVDANNHVSLCWYLDNLSLSEETIPLTGFDMSVPSGQDILNPGGAVTVNVKYTPENTTQKELVWSSNNDKVSIDTAGKVTIAEDFQVAENETSEVVVTATSKANPSIARSLTLKVVPIELPSEPYVVDFDSMYDAELSDVAKPEKTTDESGATCWKFNFTDKNQRVYFKLPEEINLSAYQKYEITGLTEFQTTLDFFDTTLVDEKAKTLPDGTQYQWWKTCAASTTPFFDGSSSARLDDGTWVAPWDKEVESKLLSSIKKTKGESADPDPGNYNKVKYISIGNACNDKVGGSFYIYSMQLTPKPTGELPKFTFTDVPMTESFEGDSNTFVEIDKSSVVDGTAQDGTHCLSVAAGDKPGILIDNRNSDTQKKYTVSAYVKAKDVSNAGTLTFLSLNTFSDKKYEKFEGYENLLILVGLKSNSKDLSSSDEWMQIKANITVEAGKISELNIGTGTTRSFAYYLDNVTVTAK